MLHVITPKMIKRLPVFIKEAETKKMIDTLNIATEDWKSLNAKILVTHFLRDRYAVK